MKYMQAMYTGEQSETVSAWLNDLRDAMARMGITVRIVMARELDED